MVFFFSARKKQKLYQQLYEDYAFTTATILASMYYKKKMVLQLSIPDEKSDYISDLVINRPYDDDLRFFKKGSKIDVCVNPKNKHDIYYPAERTYPGNAFKYKLDAFLTIFFCIAPLASIIIPLALDTSGQKFQDMAWISTNDTLNNIWTVSFNERNKIFISLYDPITQTETKEIKDKKEVDLWQGTRFYICPQEENVMIVGCGTTPVVDVYDPLLNKLSDITALEKSFPELYSGIVQIETKTNTSRLIKEDMFEIRCNNGSKYTYNATRNKLYQSSIEADNEFRSIDSLEMSKRGNAFLLLTTDTNALINTRLYSLESQTPKGINDLVFFSGSNKYNLKHFNEPDYKYLTLKPIVKYKTFIEGKIIWSDSDFVILQHFNSNVANALMHITAYNASGKQLYSFSQKYFPNIDKMREDYETSFRFLKFDDVTRVNDRIYIIFDEYGAVCLDINTWQMRWKYENPL